MHGKFPKQYFSTTQQPAAPPPPEPTCIGRLSPPASVTPPHVPSAEQHALAEDLPCSESAPQLAEDIALAARKTLPQHPEQDIHQSGQAAGSSGTLAGRTAAAQYSGSLSASSSASDSAAAGDVAMPGAATSAVRHAAAAVLPTAQLEGPDQQQQHLCVTAVRTPAARAARPEPACSAQGGAQTAPHSAASTKQHSARRRPTAYSAFSTASIRQPHTPDHELPECTAAAAAAAAKPQATPQLPSEAAASTAAHAVPKSCCAEPACEPLRLLRLQELARPASQHAGTPLAHTGQPGGGGQSATVSRTGSEAAPTGLDGVSPPYSGISCSKVFAGAAASSGSGDCSSGGAKISRAGSTSSSSSGVGARAKEAVAQQEMSADARTTDASTCKPSTSGSMVRDLPQDPLELDDVRSEASFPVTSCSGSRSSGASAVSAADVPPHESNAAVLKGSSAPAIAWTPRQSTNRTARPAARSAGGAGSAVSQLQQQHGNLASQLPAVDRRHRTTRQRMTVARHTLRQAPPPAPPGVQLQQPAAAEQIPRQHAVLGATSGRRRPRSAAATARGRNQPPQLPSAADAAHPAVPLYRRVAASDKSQALQSPFQTELPRQGGAAVAAPLESALPQRSTPRRARHPAAAVAGGTPIRSSAPGYAAMAAARRQPAGSPVAARRQFAAARSVFVQHIDAPARQPLEPVTLQQQPAAPGVILLSSAPAKGPGSAVQLLAACGADAKLAAAVATASSPTVGAHQPTALEDARVERVTCRTAICLAISSSIRCSRWAYDQAGGDMLDH